MGSARRGWLAVFTAFLLSISAVLALADPSIGEGPPPGDPPEETLPSGEHVAEGLTEAEAQEAEEEEERETPEAAEEREESLEAFAELTPEEASALLQDAFAETIAGIDLDPSRLISDAAIEEVLGSTGARVSVGGRTMLVDGTVPVRTVGEDGDPSKVDLDLIQTEDGAYVPSNPLAELILPGNVSEGIAVGDEGLTVTPVLEGALSSTGRVLGDEDLFYPETQTDTDLLAMPISAGVELFSQLRSVDSPEQLGFELTLPPGATLLEDGEGGAEVADGDRVLARIPAPRALDAQGADVPVQMRVQGASLVLEVAHRSMNLAYPVLVDPAIAEDWYNGNSWHSGASLASLTNGSWIFQSNDWGRFTYYTESPVPGLVGGSEKGLFTRANGTSSTQPAEHFGEWSYTVPGSTTWISVAGVNPLWRFNYGCSAKSYPEPHDYAGLWNSYWGWTTTVQKDPAVNQQQVVVEAPKNDWREKIGQILILGLGTGASSSPATTCTRDLYAGGAYVWMEDPEAPTLGEVTGAPSGWLAAGAPITINASASDAGLGVQHLSVNTGSAGIIQNPTDCNGLKASPCPSGRSYSFKLNAASFDEGERTATVSATDPLLKASGKYTFTTKVDRTPPDVTLSGQLATATDEAGSKEQPPGKGDDLQLPVYRLKIEAKEGSKSSATTKRSGVKSIGVYLDSKETAEQSWQQECPETSCQMTKTFVFKLVGLSTGKHTLRVIATDQLGQVQERKIEFEYFPATGIDDEYAMHYFPLPDGQGNEAEEEYPDRPEIAVNVMNGNAVYRETDIEVEGAGVDLEVERYYNSQLPDSENTEWGDGWTLEQTPELEPEETESPEEPPQQAGLLGKTGLLSAHLTLPVTTGTSFFNSDLQALLMKLSGGGFKLTDKSGESEATTVFDENGETTELRTPGFAKVEYDYDEGALSEIAVKDPASATDPSEAEEETPEYGLPTPEYQSAFGTGGEAQLESPADVALDAEGDVWVADKGHDKIKEFNAEGDLLSEFGASGEGNGQLSRPASLDLDAEGDIWVADADNHRIQEFSPQGEYLSKFGKEGNGNGGLSGPEGIAIAPDGDIWVSDTYNGRLQRFTQGGEFIEVVGSPGADPGELGEPTGIDIGPGGKVWVAEWQNNRVSVFDEEGEYLTQFGSLGDGDGEFRRPDAIDVDPQGNVWVGDQNNDRIQQFDQNGEYLAQFGSEGSGPGQFSFTWPMGVTTDSEGGIWVADPVNDRVQKWQLPIADPGEGLPEENDPFVDVDVSAQLVQSVEGEEAGEHTYEHSGDDLTAHIGPEGKTKYEYDTAGRLKKVTLPNGTYAKMTYNATYGRVATVTVDPAGSEPSKVTHFAYDDEPRRTTVEPPDAPTITYDIGADGSVLKWWNALVPPVFQDLAGSLYAEKETSSPISAGDKSLLTEAHSAEGIASIQVIANGNTLVDEETCEQDPEKAGTECVNVINEWVTATENHAPGRLDLEVIITDRIGQIAAERFWVNVPEPPPPPADGAPMPPKFADVLRFREEFGLDIVDPAGDETVINDRVFETIGAWWEGDPIARASAERWGVPMRLRDVAEMEYREQYMAHNLPLIENWAESNSPSSYAGYYVDHRNGGIVNVGFTQNQGSRVLELKQQLNLIAPDRLEPYPTSPTTARLSLQGILDSIDVALDTNGVLADLVTELGIDEKANSVHVGATNVTEVQAILTSLLGSTAPVSVAYEEAGEPFGGRNHTSGRILAGDKIINELPEACTAGFGAWEAQTQKSTGELIVARFLLTAGHCGSLGEEMERSPDSSWEHEKEWKKIGRVARTGAPLGGQQYETDASAIRLQGSELAPRSVYRTSDKSRPVDPPGTAKHGEVLCFSGQRTNAVKCGEMVGVRYRQFGTPGRHLFIIVRFAGIGGDSGAPVWNPRTGTSIGLVSGGPNNGKIKSWVTPLVVPRGFSAEKVPGALRAPGMGTLSLIEGS